MRAVRFGWPDRLAKTRFAIRQRRDAEGFDVPIDIARLPRTHGQYCAPTVNQVTIVAGNLVVCIGTNTTGSLHQQSNPSPRVLASELCYSPTSDHQSRAERLALPKMHAQSEEMLHLDLTRLIASVGIVLHHSIEFFVPASQRQLLGEKTMGLALFVDLFFVISGFVIAFVYHERALSLKGYLRFLQRRVGRLVPLHWLTLLGSILIWTVFLLAGYGGNHPPSFRAECIADTAVLLHSFVPCRTGDFFNRASWSISTEMVMYVVAFPVIAVFAARYRWAPIAGIILSAAFLAVTDMANHWATILSWLDVHPLIRALPSFCFGAALYYNRGLVALLPAPRATFAGSIMAMMLLMVSGAPHLAVLVLAYLVAASGVAADLTEKPGPLVKRFGPFGQLTYSIYMWHGLFILVLMNAVGDKLLHAKPGLMALLAIICWGSIFAVSYFSFFYIENPSRRWVDNLGGRTAAKKTSPA
jgi:peptidoglycan/LPS O-acetylase OafA/YrhL